MQETTFMWLAVLAAALLAWLFGAAFWRRYVRGRVTVYEHQATVLSQPTEQNRGLRAHADRHDIDWNGCLPATAATSAGVGVSRPRIGR